MADAKKQCRKCEYWIGWNRDNCVCNYLLYTNKRRVEVDGVCKSFKKKQNKEQRL